MEGAWVARNDRVQHQERYAEHQPEADPSAGCGVDCVLTHNISAHIQYD